MTESTASPEKFAYAVGKYIYFRYLTREDALGDWHRWFNSPEVTRNLDRQRWLNTPEDQVAYWEHLQTSRERLAVAIIDRTTHKHIGIGSLSGLDTVNRRAEISLVIGSAAHRHGLHALEAVTMLTEIGLIRLNLHKLIATGLTTSERGLRLNRLLGYTESGRYRENSFVEGEWVDNLILEIFQRDWLTSPRRPKTLAWADPGSADPT